VPLHLTEGRFRQPQVERLVPPGFRVATTIEAALMWRYEPEPRRFEESLLRRHGAWVAEVGLERERCHLISQDGLFQRISLDQYFYSENVQKLAWLTSGAERVTVSIGHENQLRVSANHPYINVFRNPILLVPQTTYAVEKTFLPLMRQIKRGGTISRGEIEFTLTMLENLEAINPKATAPRLQDLLSDLKR
ncbi:MAG: hypothetical protein KGH62_03750, partial [Candidatus Micrarchaeota archaeon]|nr:hypothetical protein [Candidatus Micrarchaeota archaeon]